MTVFDCCDTTTPAGRRDVTTVAPQALTLMNNQSILEESRAIARRILGSDSLGSDSLSSDGSSPRDARNHIAAAWQMVLAREPSDRELGLALEHLQNYADREQALASLCHVLINTNEFIYVD